MENDFSSNSPNVGNTCPIIFDPHPPAALNHKFENVLYGPENFSR